MLVAKIEKAEAIENLDEIIEETDGVMVARGDLGVETSVELVPVYQKRIIEKAVANDKFVITATQMLQSMIDNPYPTRAEAQMSPTRCGTAPMRSCFRPKRHRAIIRSRRSRRWPASSTRPKLSSRRSAKAGQILASPSGRTSQALCKAAAYAAEGDDDGKDRGVHRIRIDGPPPFGVPFWFANFRINHLRRYAKSVGIDLGRGSLPS